MFTSKSTGSLLLKFSRNDQLVIALLVLTFDVSPPSSWSMLLYSKTCFINCLNSLLNLLRIIRWFLFFVSEFIQLFFFYNSSSSSLFFICSSFAVLSCMNNLYVDCSRDFAVWALNIDVFLLGESWDGLADNCLFSGDFDWGLLSRVVLA